MQWQLDAIQSEAFIALLRSHNVTSTQPGVVPREEYIATLARKWMAAGALLRDEFGRVLLVHPVYRDTWDVPGGVVEAEESPHSACRREVSEEIGLNRPVGRVLAVDWVPSEPDYPEGLVVIYDGGVLRRADIASITLPAEELRNFAFVSREQIGSQVRPIVRRRVFACLDALASGTVAALDNGTPIS